MNLPASSRNVVMRLLVTSLLVLSSLPTLAQEEQEPITYDDELDEELISLLRSPGVDPSFTTFEVLCIDTDRKPLAGVDVSLVRLAARHQGSALHPLADGVTDESGRCRFEGLLESAEEYKRDPLLAMMGWTRFGLISKKAGYASWFHRATLGNRKHGVVMFPEARLSGLVTDQLGAPVPNARVWVRGHLLGMEQDGVTHLFSTTADERGRYSIDRLPIRDFVKANRESRELAKSQGASPAVYSCAVAASHGRYDYGRAIVNRIPSEVNIELKSGAAMEGRAVWSDGSPLVGATVLLRGIGFPIPEGETNSIHLYTLLLSEHQTTTDAQGGYSFSSLPPGGYEISLRLDALHHAGTPRFIAENQIKRDCDVTEQTERLPDLRVSKGRLLRVQLVDGETQEPLVAENPLIATARFTPSEAGHQDVEYASLACSPEGLLELLVPKVAGKLSLKLRSRDEPDPRKVFLPSQPEAFDIPAGQDGNPETIVICPVPRSAG